MACKLVLPSKEIIKLSSVPQSYEDLLSAIRNRLEVNYSENILLKYMDVDKELVSLTNEEDFQTAKLSNEAEQIKTLKVFILPEGDSYNPPINSRPSIKPSGADDSNFLDLTNVHGGFEASTKTATDMKYTIKRAKTAPFENTSDLQELDHLQLTNDQLEVIDNFIGLKIKSAVEENIKNFLPKLVTKFPVNGSDKNIPPEATSTPSRNTIGPLSCPIARSKTFMFRKSTNVVDTGESLCNECEKQINGVKYICLECSSYKCCEECEGKIEHDHPLLKVRVSLQNKQISPNAQQRQSLSYSMFISPEKSSKGCVGNLVVRQSLNRSSCEKKPQYSGKIYSQNVRDTPISVSPSQEYEVIINIKNTGTETWPKDVKLCCVNGVHRNVEKKLSPLEARENQTICLSLEAPANAGKYLSQWRLYYNDGEKPRSFGESLFIEIQVEDNKVAQTKNQRKSDLVLTEVENVSNYKQARSMDQSPVGLNSKGLGKSSAGSNKKEKIANYLNEIFPGNLEEKFYFLNGFVSVEEHAIEKIVESYLVSLSKPRAQKGFKNKEVHTRQRHELSLTL